MWAGPPLPAPRDPSVNLTIVFSQESLARAAKVHPTYISLIERGLRDPRLTSIAKLAKALKTSPADLVLEAERGR